MGGRETRGRPGEGREKGSGLKEARGQRTSEVGCLSGSYPGVGSLAEVGETLLGRLSSGGSDHSWASPSNWLKFCCLLRPREVSGHHDIHLATEVGFLGGYGWEVPPAHAHCPQTWYSCFSSGPLGALETSGISTCIQLPRVSSEEVWITTPVAFCSVLHGTLILAGHTPQVLGPSLPGFPNLASR